MCLCVCFFAFVFASVFYRGAVCTTLLCSRRKALPLETMLCCKCENAAVLSNQNVVLVVVVGGMWGGGSGRPDEHAANQPKMYNTQS